MSDGLLLGWMLLAWGAQAAVPWRLAGVAPETAAAAWALALLPLLVTGALAAFAHLQVHPDAAVAQGLYPLGASIVGRTLAVLFAAMALAGRPRSPPAGAAWRPPAGGSPRASASPSCSPPPGPPS